MRLGTIGTNWITRKFVDAAHQDGFLKLTAVYSRKMETGEKLAAHYGVQNVYTDLQAMFDAVDVVYVASPINLHFQYTKAALLAGKHVICEKTAFSNLKEYEEIKKLREETGLFVMEAMRTTQNPNAKRIKDALQKIAPVRYAHLPYMQYSSRYDSYKKGEIFPVFDNAYSGGSLYDLGVYSLYLALYLFGLPKKMEFMAVKLDTGVAALDAMLLGYDSMIAVVSSGKICDNYEHCEIMGENGSIVLSHPGDVDKAVIKTKTGEELIVDQTYENDMFYEAKEFARILKEQDRKAEDALFVRTGEVIKILQEARKKENIVFGSEQA